MRSEREQEAKEFRAQGAEEAQKIRSDAEKQKTILIAEAKREAESIRGNGDGEAIKIYADAFGKDAKFFKFYRSMLAYEKTFIDKDTTMILSPESEFFDFFSDKKGN
jgi:membrane protease subunit HflC